ncbi:prepilin-type N-terminal cleavage/methylation domain-containing protein [Acidovorax sp. 69]|uniref:type II secretion system protein n=1 Tax=Acidovorax sp. 69 TaxID=2035202 RepID=UPI000C23FA27|nr:prepilin-type N-terminal cleavage/methylation domain-containing protein [Acidovorax sp. 69]PJI97107.1 prepilin-type N-terminal cleavage/methylation domain-containing protein [Acidovorax sp. 69]
MTPISAIYPAPGGKAKRSQHGFSLVELSVVLIVIGLVLGAVAVGRDLQRSAANQRLSTDFIQGWQLAYEAYFNGVGHPPGDSATSPTGRVNGNVAPAGTELCGTEMINAFLAAGIRVPTGRTEGQQDRYVYLDSNGNPQEARVCFRSVNWSEPAAAVGRYVALPRNVMVIRGLTFSLAGSLDQQIDGRTDARFGSLREGPLPNGTVPASNVVDDNPGMAWSIDDRVAFGATLPTSLDESQIAITTGFFKMMR